MKVKSESEVTQSCPTPSYPMDCSPPGSSVHGIFQASVLEWVVNGKSAVNCFSDKKNLHTHSALIRKTLLTWSHPLIFSWTECNPCTGELAECLFRKGLFTDSVLSSILCASCFKGGGTRICTAHALLPSIEKSVQPARTKF